MKNYSLLKDFIIATRCFDCDFGLAIRIKYANLISELSEAIGKMNIYNVIGDTENVSYMEQIIENKLEDECISIDEYFDWFEENRNLKIEENA